MQIDTSMHFCVSVAANEGCVDKPFWIRADHVETTSEGAFFKIEITTAGLSSPDELSQRYQEALNTVDAFCQSFFDDDRFPAPDKTDLDRLGDWPCDEFRMMLFKYRGLGGDQREMAIIIADRWLAASFKKVFCSR